MTYSNHILFSRNKSSVCRYIKYSINKNFYSDVSKAVGKSINYEVRSCSDNKLLGKMVTTPARRGVNGDKYPALYIDYLVANVTKEGIGLDLIKMAENESKRCGLEGKLSLLASKVYSPKSPPHLFYKKLGFKSKSTFWNLVMDMCLKFGINFNKLLPKNIMMYK